MQIDEDTDDEFEDAADSFHDDLEFPEEEVVSKKLKPLSMSFWKIVLFCEFHKGSICSGFVDSISISV
jgi:hypothetical protein